MGQSSSGDVVRTDNGLRDSMQHLDSSSELHGAFPSSNLPHAPILPRASGQAHEPMAFSQGFRWEVRPHAWTLMHIQWGDATTHSNFEY